MQRLMSSARKVFTVSWFFEHDPVFICQQFSFLYIYLSDRGLDSKINGTCLVLNKREKTKHNTEP